MNDKRSAARFCFFTTFTKMFATSVRSSICRLVSSEILCKVESKANRSSSSPMTKSLSATRALIYLAFFLNSTSSNNKTITSLSNLTTIISFTKLEPAAANSLQKGIECCDHIYCCDCINHHIEAKLCLGMMPSCPGCNAELKLDDCINIVAPHMACLMKQMVKEAMIPVTEKFYCPYQSCSTLMTKTEADQLPKSTSGATKCAKCGREFCYSCGVQWHKNMSCVEYQNGVQSFDKVHIMSLLIDDILSQCRKCNQGIEKVAGCNHMTCRCGHEFCFICEVEWKNCRCPVFSSEDSGNHFEDEPDVDENEEREYHSDTSMDY